MGAAEHLEAKIEEICALGQEVTLGAIGGFNAIPAELANSAMFPYAAEAIVLGWDELEDSQHGAAASMFVTAITTAQSGLALNDTCKAVVPSAAALEIHIPLKDALREKASTRSNPSEGALAAISIQWLAHLAVGTHTARPGLCDLFTAIPSESRETREFAIAAAQAAGIAYDHWRDQNARECLSRLTDTDAEADAWFGLGQAMLVDALEEDGSDAMVEGLQRALSCFEKSERTGESRSDAALYVHIIRFVTALANNATAEALLPHVRGAEEALAEYVLGGTGLPERPTWLRPRYAAENAWMSAIQRIHQAVGPQTRTHAWYNPAIVINSLSDAYKASNSLLPLRHKYDDAENSAMLTRLIAPRLTAPFLERTERLALVDEWLKESGSPDAEAFAQLVNEAAERLLDNDAANSQVVPPKAQPPGSIRR